MTNTGPTHRNESGFERLAALFGIRSQHNLVLAGMPPTILCTYLIATQVLNATGSAITASALVSTVLVADDLFRRPPIPG
ncbi:hypothetical protein [Haloferax volcanii]|uniref:Uncharacterized protein n=1 Tax=Haloferax volcanii TaxID=2246 RepID=A0A8T5CHC0_HALVO|nr:hypothetical protein [Haloferax volcanii]MBS8121306.1 hypothetical protein [Haloferax volcanii]MBS8126318.1 hypothetical protein [Haloferax volcanii]MBS8130184.1 hypothetical protein [Haloferax volcanii]MBS8134062.1 hypothetical protein [Haloferax volcanii]MDW7539438.1 hypothetical protein [Haloferax volcanii]